MVVREDRRVARVKEMSTQRDRVLDPTAVHLLFRAFDGNRDHCLKPGEFRKAIEALGMLDRRLYKQRKKPNHLFVAKLLRLVDNDKSGVVTEKEFAKVRSIALGAARASSCTRKQPGVRARARWAYEECHRGGCRVSIEREREREREKRESVCVCVFMCVFMCVCVCVYVCACVCSCV